MSPSPAGEVVSLGCRLNHAESDAIRQWVAGRDTVVVNSCAVTAEAVKQSRAAIRRVRRDRPDAEIVVTGCAATIDPAGFAGMPEVARVVANDAKLSPASWGANALPVPAPTGPAPTGPVSTGPVSTGPVSTGPVSTGHARALVEVQNGCDHACTFCVIPQGRGVSRSVPAGAVIDRIAALVAGGHREVVLTGVDLTSYGPDLPGAPSLGLLVERILTHVPGLARLRLSSLDSVEIDERLLDLIVGEPRVAPHLHLSLQAGSDLVLKRMKRRHLRADAVRLVERIKARRDVAIGADLIAGFPTEDDAMAAETLALLDDCDIVHAHIFPYSPRAGTPAARMPQVASEVRRARAAALREAAARRKRAWLAGKVGSTVGVLVERPCDRGHDGQFAEVRFASPAPEEQNSPLRLAGTAGRSGQASTRSWRTEAGAGITVGRITPVRITAAHDTHLEGMTA